MGLPTRLYDPSQFSKNIQNQGGSSQQGLIRILGQSCTLSQAGEEIPCRVLEVFFKGLTCLGENEITSAGLTFQGGGCNKASRQITYRGLVQHVLSKFALSFTAAVPDFQGNSFETLEGAALALQISPAPMLPFLWTSTVTQKNQLGCPIELCKGIAVSSPHELPKESTEDALTENVEAAMQKAVQEVEKGIRNIGRFFKKL